MTRERRRHGGPEQRPPPPSSRRARPPQREWSRVVLVAILSCLIGFGAFAYSGYRKWSLGVKVVTLHPSPPILPPNSSFPHSSPDLFWGSYRPQVYFGMKTRSARSVVTGSYNHLVALCPGLQHITDVVRGSLTDRFIHPSGGPGGNRRRYFGVDVYNPPPQPEHSQIIVHQITMALPFQAEFLFESDSFVERSVHLSGNILTNELQRHQQDMAGKFRQLFRLEEKGFIPEQVTFAQAALSNMVGGMGYFYGSSLVQSRHNPEPVAYPLAPLFTAVPSRSFFPRGFLWDEGFHLLLIARWDPALAWQSLAHWLDLMNADGWIPREQILGPEARSKVPSEFVIQWNENANPPTLFLALRQLLAGGNVPSEGRQILRRAFPRLQTWYNWFNETQSGPLPYTYRWRGRDKDTLRFLNPKTLTSGLDDYPRASHPSDDERHVDLRCWMALASDVMADISDLLGVDGGSYKESRSVLADNALLDRLHWFERLGAYADYGNHTQNVALEWERPRPYPGQDPRSVPPPRLIRVVKKTPKLQYVGALGYVSLFPFLLQLLSPDSPKLGRILEQIRDSDKLWTPYGIRSLSRSSPIYMQRNTEHDPPYWRGPIWINMNYLAVRALHYYSQQEGPHRERASSVYRELRINLIANLFRQYKETGFLWEQYNDQTGRGQGCHPFTGWSSLIVLIMAEEY
uniref:Mannosyl-oligosaccharide glucosidase n=1 Tax=Pyxicephalus adspersus TaxID=30357 RepID=A0AAV3ASQ9_PYXAD|nr:TPA: hypothetical protein GDO54_009780 [Pyxicephalus adspersus]